LLKILIVGPAWVGDMVMAQSLFIQLKQHAPTCQIDVLAPVWSLPLLARMPEVNHAIAMPLTHGQFGLTQRYQLGKFLRAERYAQAMVLPNSWKSALIPFFANIPKRTGYWGECRVGLLNDGRKLDKNGLTMTVQRFVALGLDAHSALPPAYLPPALHITAAQQRAALEKFDLTATPKILGLCPGAEFGAAKRWPTAHYAEVARQALAHNWQVWLFGSEKDQTVTAALNDATQNQCVNFAGKTNLAEAVDLLSLVDTVISNDSGLMHVAAALDKKLIALYGSSDPLFTPPLNSNAQVMSLNLPCSPCFKRECPLGHTHCLTDIAPAQVLALLGL
jgi:heptosyltransferase-2